MTQSITAQTAKYALHFGVVPYVDFPGEVSIDLDGQIRRLPEATRKEMTLWDEANSIAFLSGSWGCWGEHDQVTDGDPSLHIVVYVNHPGQSIAQSAATLRSVIEAGVASGRVLDWAVVSSAVDWSNQTHTVLFGTQVVEVERRGRADSHVRY